MIDGNQLREEFGRYLAEHKATRWGMDAALMHVCKIAYDAGKADGPGEHLNGAAETLDKLLTDRMKRSVKVEQVLQDVTDGKRPVLTPDECRALSLSLGTPDEDFSCAKAVRDTLYSQEFEIEVPVEPGLHPLVFTGLPLRNWRDEQLHALCQEMGEALQELVQLEADGKHTDECAIEVWEKSRATIAKWKEAK